jgi:hypothetical protein
VSARCLFFYSGYGLDEDACGAPADDLCEDCDKPICLEHSSRTPAGHPECPSCKEDRLQRVAREHARRERP